MLLSIIITRNERTAKHNPFPKIRNEIQIVQNQFIINACEFLVLFWICLFAVIEE